MDKMRELADAYYQAGTEDIKQLAHNVLKSMDRNGDRKVGLSEYLDFTIKRGYSRMSNKEWFDKLDKDKKGSLNFDDVMTLYYIVKSGRPFCNGCGEFVSGVFFTCVKCFDRSSTYSVCLQCYESNNIAHKHKEFLDNFALLEAKRRKSQFPALKTAPVQKDPHPRGSERMKELRQIAMAYCRSTSEDTTEDGKIRKFFSLMHHGNHERVALHEFLEFMRQKTYKKVINSNLDLEFMNTPEFFRKLDKDKKGLDFSDVKTLYYIIRSGRPFCKGCGEFIEGLFFTCGSCFFDRHSTCFSLCFRCYKGKKFIHRAHLFFDNYSLLEVIKETAWKASQPKTQPSTTKASTSSAGSLVPSKVNNKPSTTKASTSSAGSLVPSKVNNKATNAKDTFEAFESALNMATAAAMAISGFSAVCVIL